MLPAPLVPCAPADLSEHWYALAPMPTPAAPASPPALLTSPWQWFARQAPLLLLLTTLIWGCNAVAARLAVGEVSPMMLTTARWGICCLALWLCARREIAAHWRSLRPHWRYLALMGTGGFTAFNALFYTAAHHTSAANISIIQGTIPILVLIGGFVFSGTRATPVQTLGVAVTLAGIAVVASHGDPAVLMRLGFNVGDVWVLIASLFYAAYMLALRRRPNVPPLVFFAALAAVSTLASLPLLALEVARGDYFAPTPTGWAIVLFVGLFPSFVSQITFIHAVSLIGPARAGVYMNLTPIFGPLLAVLILDEPLALYHGVALVLVLGGIWIAERLGRRAA